MIINSNLEYNALESVKILSRKRHTLHKKCALDQTNWKNP